MQLFSQNSRFFNTATTKTIISSQDWLLEFGLTLVPGNLHGNWSPVFVGAACINYRGPLPFAQGERFPTSKKTKLICFNRNVWHPHHHRGRMLVSEPKQNMGTKATSEVYNGTKNIRHGRDFIDDLVLGQEMEPACSLARRTILSKHLSCK